MAAVLLADNENLPARGLRLVLPQLQDVEVKTLKSGLSPEDALKVRDEYVAKWKQLWGLGKTLPH